MKPIHLLLLSLALALPGSLSAGVLPAKAQPILVHGDSRIGTYVSSPRGFDTSSYWIEGPTGLIWIDTQFLLNEGEEALDWAEAVTGKKVQLAIVLHPNPDKFNGTGRFQKRGIKVVTSDQVKALIPEVHRDRHHWFFERYKPDYPAEAPTPDSFGPKTKELSAGGITVKAHVLGIGCSGAHVVVEYDKHVFPGDLITNGNHSWIELGELDEWLKRLDEIETLDPEYVHPGRGPSAGAELITRERAYLTRVRDLVRSQKPRLPVKEATMEKLQTKIEELYPGYGYAHFVEIGLPSVWEHEAKRSAAGSRRKK